MALTIINTPLKVAPVYNPNYFIVDSTNKSEDNFEYLYDVYESQGNTLGDRLIRVRIPAEPISGWGVYNPMKILQTQVENVFDYDLTGCSVQDFVEYTIKVGEAYTFEWPFNSVFGLAVSGTGCLLNVVLTGTTQHFYNTGDTITLQGSSIPQYNGTWSVIQVPNNNQVVLDLCVSSLSSTSGTTKLFNDEQTFFTGLTSFTQYYAHNAAINTYDFIPYRVEPFFRDTYYTSTGGTALWYSNVPDGYKTRITNRGHITYFNNVYSGNTYPEVDGLKVVTNDGNEIIIDLPCKKEVLSVGVFPWNINNADAADITIINGSIPAITPNTDSYDVCLINLEFTSVDIIQDYPGVVLTATTIYKTGTYNGYNYFSWTDGGNTFFLWFNSGSTVWEVTNALGGGNDYLNSINSGSKTCPPIGIYNTEWIDASNPLFTDFQTLNCINPCLNQPLTLNIYEYCHKWDNYEFIFMDRKAGFIPMNFELVQRKNVGVERKSFKKGLEYNYTSLDRGKTIVQNNITYRYTVTSNWMDEATSLYFEELMTSPEIYWNYEGTGEFIPINLTITEQEIKDKRNTRLIQYTLQFELGNDIIGMLG